MRDVEQAMVSAARKHFNAVDTEEFTAELDRISGKIRVYRGDEEILCRSLNIGDEIDRIKPWDRQTMSSILAP